MKTIKTLTILLLVALFSSMGAFAQEKVREREERAEREMERLKAIKEKQEKVKALQEKDLLKIFEETRQLQEFEWQMMQEMNQEAPEEMLPKLLGLTDPILLMESTNLQISKDIEDLDYENDFMYEVPEGSRSISLNANGRMDEGVLQISFIQPDGKLLQEIEVSPLANISWHQSLQWDEEKASNFVGSWKIIIKAEEATGNYQVSIRNR